MRIFEVRIPSRGLEQSTKVSEEASNAREDTVASEIIDESDSAFLGADAYLYADDAALVDLDLDNLNKMVNILDKSSESRADMKINASKTFGQKIAKAVKIEHSKEEEYRSFEFSKYCKNCGDGFPCNHGLKVHLSSCNAKYNPKLCEVDPTPCNIIDTKVYNGQRFYQVIWDTALTNCPPDPPDWSDNKEFIIDYVLDETKMSDGKNRLLIKWEGFASEVCTYEDPSKFPPGSRSDRVVYIEQAWKNSNMRII